MAFSDSNYVNACLCRCRISRTLLKPLGFGMSAGFRLVWVECRKSVLVPVWFPPQQSVRAAGYDVCFVKVFLLEVFLLVENIELVLQFIYLYNLCHLLVEQSLFPEFVFGTVLLTSNVRVFFNFY